MGARPSGCREGLVGLNSGARPSELREELRQYEFVVGGPSI